MGISGPGMKVVSGVGWFGLLSSNWVTDMAPWQIGSAYEVAAGGHRRRMTTTFLLGSPYIFSPGRVRN